MTNFISIIYDNFNITVISIFIFMMEIFIKKNFCDLLFFIKIQIIVNFISCFRRINKLYYKLIII